MMIKENSLIAIGHEDTVPDYDFREEVKVLAYELQNEVKATTKVLDMNRNEMLQVQVLKHENIINIEATGTDKTWTMVLKNIVNVKEVEGAEFKVDGNDTVVMMKSGNSKVVCRLA